MSFLKRIFGNKPASEHKPVVKEAPIEMIFVEGGAYIFGESKAGVRVDSDYAPRYYQQKVTVDSFYIGKYPITQRQWIEIMGEDRINLGKCLDCPVEQISWEDTQEFLHKLNAKYPGNNYRLPTDIEWEWAARGGEKNQGYEYAGSNDPNEVAWYRDNSGDERHPVGKKKPNALGIYDMNGNVWEWCEDLFHEIDKYRVLRGGSFNVSNSLLRLSDHNHYVKDYRGNGFGLRCVKSLPNV